MPRPLTLCEKLLANAAIDLETPGEVQVGQTIRVKVDWVIASELSWSGMESTYDEIGRPALRRPDRFWLAADHVVDPRVYSHPKIKTLIEKSERIAREAGLKDYQAPNQTILHTFGNFFQAASLSPGQIVIGSDSHTCSSGALGTFACGLGAADVVMPLVTGETWFKIPETCEIRFEGEPSFAIGGKDVMLYVLGMLKRNTVASERAVEYTGPGLKFLSCDARFAISNMTTEFGGITGVFVPDEQVAAFVAARSSPEHRSASTFFKPDADAVYSSRHVIDLTEVPHLLALYPSPDNVVPAKKIEEQGMPLDGVFIGACTTTEEDLILGALVLEAGLKAGMVPSAQGKRRVTPGSVNIIANLKRAGLLIMYERAGFVIGAPGCSYCIGMSADKAAAGETWLSSQNRNFENRMGRGSFGNLASAATVAASSFEMTVRDPTFLLKDVSRARFNSLRGVTKANVEIGLGSSFVYSEPSSWSPEDEGFVEPPPSDAAEAPVDRPASSLLQGVIQGKMQRLGMNIDTDALIPADFLHPGVNPGEHCLEYTHPEFRGRVKEGYNIVVADEGFGSGSSRENAVTALKEAGCQAAIAKSFAYIFNRNMPNLGFLGIALTNEAFYRLVDADPELTISINISARTVTAAGETFVFTLSETEVVMLEGGGVVEMFKQHGARLFQTSKSLMSSGSKLHGGAVEATETSYW